MKNTNLLGCVAVHSYRISYVSGENIASIITVKKRAKQTTNQQAELSLE
jgi:hypothetical protein